MKIKDEIKFYIAKRDYEMKQVALEALDISLQNFSNKLYNETIQYRDIKKVADYLGYEIKWVKK